MGREIALALARKGHDIAVVDVRDDWGAEAVEAIEKETGGRAIYVKTDISKRADVAAMVTAVLKEAVDHFHDFDRECVTVNPDMTQDEANVVVSHRDKGVERIKAAVAMMDRIEQQ